MMTKTGSTKAKPAGPYDLFVIGAGSGGVRAARMAASMGKRVGLAEERYLGGTCVNVGCVPKKLMVLAADFRETFDDAAGFGWTLAEPGFDWPALVERIGREIERLQGVYAGLLERSGVERFDVRARLLGAHAVEVGGRRVEADNILVATGSWPAMPDIPGIEHALTSNEMFTLLELPSRVAIIGGGYIAVEFAGILRGFGADVHLIHRGERVLRGFDGDVRDLVGRQMQDRGVAVRLSTEVKRIEKRADYLLLALSDGTVLEVDALLAATGRRPFTSGLGLEAAGVALGPDGAVLVDEHSRSSVPSIWAVGDATNRMNLTPVAIAEAMALVRTLYGEGGAPVDYALVPTAVFSHPPLGTVGLSEEAARETFGAVDIYRSIFRPMKHTLSGRDEKTLIKLVVHPQTDRVLGAHMVGPDAPEIMQGLGIALQCGVTKAQFDATVGIHPTLAEEWVTLREKAGKT